MLAQQYTSPRRVAVAVGLGVMLGCSPFLGFQVLFGLMLARLFRLNVIAVLLGVQISIPPLTPVVLFATAQLGTLVLRGHWLPLRLAHFRGIPLTTLVPNLFLDMLVGGLLVGGGCAVILGAACAVGVSRIHRHPGTADGH